MARVSTMLNVFVSSTYEDLAEHRKQVRALIEALGLNDVAMEKWPASPQPPYREVEKAIRVSHIYLGIIGWRRGSLIPDLQTSYVRFEYDLARRTPLPMLVFLADPAEPIPVNKIERGSAWDDILKFRDDVEREQTFVRNYFGGPLDLVLRVSGSLFRMLAGTNEFKALSAEDQLVLELRQIMQADFLARQREIEESQTRERPAEEATQWFLPSLGRCNLGDWYIPREDVSRRVADWLVTGESTHLFLVGPSGIGKTNFLLDFIRRAHSEQRALKRHALLMLPLGSYLPQLSFIGNVEAILNRTRRLTMPADASVLKNLIADGRLILVLDGLDEFARQQGEVACEQVFAKLRDEVRPPHVIVSCRDHILRRLRGSALLKDLATHEVKVPPLLPSEVKEALKKRMGPLSVPFRAASLHPGLLRFAENPLLFEMMCEMSDRSWRRLIEMQSTGKVYDLWFEEAVEAGTGGESIVDDRQIEDARKKVGRVARAMLERRSDLISRSTLDKQQLPPGCLRVPGQPFGLLIQETPDEWGFVHDSLRDFALAQSVTAELTSRNYELLASTTHLDFVGAEMYLFLRDLLGSDHEAFARHVDDALTSRTEKPKAWNSIVWNCFEAAGMIATADSAGAFVDKAVGILSSETAADHGQRMLTGEAQYNIVRCLERLHASAPKPFCDHVISRAWPSSPGWALFGAWAVRGFQRTERRLAAYPPMTYHWERNDGSAHRQEEVSACLLDLLENSLESALDEWTQFVGVNCTLALIRWLHPSHVSRLKVLPSTGQLGPEARANLFLAFTRFKSPSLLEGTSDLFSGMILNYSYLSREMLPRSDFAFRRVEFQHRQSRFEGLDLMDTRLFEDCRFPF
jgi:hypothetical protein